MLFNRQAGDRKVGAHELEALIPIPKFRTFIFTFDRFCLQLFFFFFIF